MNNAPARRIFLEAFVIVASILLAFALDAWWDERQEQERIDRLLDAVAVDFESEVAVLDSIIAANDTMGDYVEAVLNRADPRYPPIGSDSLADLAQEANDHQIYDPAFGSLSALIATGGLERIEDPELQRLLAGWEAELGDLTWERSQTYDAMDAFLRGMTETGRITPSLDIDSWAVTAGRAVSDDPRMRERMALVHLVYGLYTSDLRRIRGRAADVAARIRAREG